MRTAEPLQSIGRALEVLERVADAPEPLGLSAVAATCGLPLSTTHRVVRSLTAGGYLHQDRDRRYRLGPRLIALGGAALGPLDAGVAGVAGWLDRLVAATGETASAASLCGDTVVFLAQASSPHAMRTATRAHHTAMPHCSAVGKALLSMLADDDVAALADRTGLPRHTDRTVTTVEQLLADVRRVRSLGHAVDDEEGEAGARCVAVPVPHAPLPLAVSVSGPAARLTRERVPAVARELAAVVHTP